MAKLKKIYIDEIAAQTQAMLERASKKHKSITAYCLFLEGDHYHVLLPEYESPKEEEKAIRNIMEILLQRPEICKEFAKFVCPPARYFEREAKKAAKQEMNDHSIIKSFHH